MRQVVQNFRSGKLSVEDVPPASVRSGGVLVATARSLISAGTEKSTVDVARKSLLGKALEKPAMARKVVDKALKDGIQDTMKMVFQRLDSPVALGYSCAGTVVEVGSRVQGIRVGDRVACAGQNYASHAELIYVPQNLCTRIPDPVSFDDASYVTLGAIAMQGVRQAEPRLGDIVAVIGLGLLGQLTIQMLRANGCRVIAADIAAGKLDLARASGAESAVVTSDLAATARSLSAGKGVDAVIIAASTKDNGPVEIAGEICRKKGRVVVLGAVGMNLPREPYYLKELELRLSTSYGPGRYDPEYEEKGQDYPYAYVRWTEQRNMEAFLWLLAEGKVNVKPLTTHHFEIADAESAYQLMMAGTEPYMGIVLAYPEVELPWRRPPPLTVASQPSGKVSLGLIGAGNHVRDMLLPHVTSAPEVSVRWVCNGTAITANALGTKLGVAGRTTRFHDVLADEGVNTVLIGTRHGSHAAMVTAALNADKHVFVEKPLCLTMDELEQIQDLYSRKAQEGLRLLVGFNRRFSSHASHAQRFFAGRREPLVMIYRVNAGEVPPGHWVQDAADGGGRIIGEGCHFIDYMQFVSGARPVRVRATAIDRHSSGITSDHSLITCNFADGSVGTLMYAAGGDSSLPKERFEAIGGGKALTMEDFIVTTCHAGGRRSEHRTRKRDKGFAQEMSGFLEEVRTGGHPSIPFEDIVAVSRTCILAEESLRTGDDYSV